MTSDTPDNDLKTLVNQWIEYDPNIETKVIIANLKEKNDWSTLESLMRPRISFGTAGLRAEMGPGFARMNELTVMQASQGLASYVKEHTGKPCPIAAVGYDHRTNSKRFSQITADAFLKKGFKVFLFEDIVPTPLLAFSVLHLQADIGVMITASHNPKSDNGYKVYWSNGAQIIPPHDASILSSILKNLAPWPASIKDGLGQTFVPNTLDAYLASITSILSIKQVPISAPRVVYTAMHGVGHQTVKAAIKACGFPELVPVASQVVPDPEFPTAPKPNPEEAGAFDEAFKTAECANANVIFSNDPDADRFSLAERLPDGKWKIFTGDEVGIILASYLVEEGIFSQCKNTALLNTVVSSSLLSKMASDWAAEYTHRSFKYDQCLTGFKNIVNSAQALMDEGYSVALAYEEALGYMCGTNVMDKDGISALVIAYECLLKSHPETFSQRLDRIYKKHGYVSVFNHYYLASNALLQIPAAFSVLSQKVKAGMTLSDGTQITSVEDKSSSKSFIVTIKKPESIKISFRASGTEPKLKFYSQLGPVAYSTDKKCVLDLQLQHTVLSLINQFLDPITLDLIPSPQMPAL